MAAADLTVFVIGLLLLFAVAVDDVQCKEDIGGRGINLTQCKVTHRGTEYLGQLSRTEGGANCQFWTRFKSELRDNFNDSMFPDGSIRAAHNHCRNPGGVAESPWCFTTQPDLLKDLCHVPFCHQPDCRITGPGMDFSGHLNKSASGKKCLKWKKTHVTQTGGKISKYPAKNFPEDSVVKAASNCRNPDGRTDGPWCYVDSEHNGLSSIELCDVPFCDDIDPMMVSLDAEQGYYSHWTRINSSDTFNLSLRLWHEDDRLSGRVFVLLSTVDIACRREDVKNWGAGLEIELSHFGTVITMEEESVGEDTPHILTAARWTTILVSWKKTNSSLFVDVYDEGSSKSIALAEINIQDKLLSNSELIFLGLTGSTVFWNLTTSSKQCNIETTSQLNFTRFWELLASQAEREVFFYVRGLHSAILEFRTSPTDVTKRIWVSLSHKNLTSVTYFGSNGVSIVIKEVYSKAILDFWRWQQFRISILGELLQVFAVFTKGTDLLLEVKHQYLRDLLWVSLGSDVVVHWAMYCDPQVSLDTAVPIATGSECVTSSSGEDYNGTLSTTGTGHQCLPWVGVPKDLAPEKHTETMFERFGGRLTCKAYCRNLAHDPAGPYCFVRKDNTSRVEYCRPRLCFAGECRVAGTANDYAGRQNSTTSGRLCLHWSHLNETNAFQPINFPDSDPADASNFCRNPSRSIGGPWCFVNDTQLRRDICAVRDCGRDLDCSLLVSQRNSTSGRRLYIQPSWKENGLRFWVKNWDPDVSEGLMFEVTSGDTHVPSTVQVTIDDDQVSLLLVLSNGTKKLLERKSAPHLILSGKWRGLWLRTTRDKIELGHEEFVTAFFEWTNTNDSVFNPVFLSVGTLSGHWIGLSFQCTECLIEVTTTSTRDVFYPFRLWRGYGEESAMGLTLFLRGSGVFLIGLASIPDEGESVGVLFNTKSKEISVVRFEDSQDLRVLQSFSFEIFPVKNSTWSELKILYSESGLSVRNVVNGSELFAWASDTPLLVYWFTVSAYNGSLTWTANCAPLDIDPPRRDGSWSAWAPWSCSVTCGKGVGRTHRTCENPVPNVFGRLCRGRSVYEGACNDFPCGEISPETYRSVRNLLSTSFNTLEVPIGGKVVIPCETSVIQKITSEAPELKVVWLLNGSPVNQSRTSISEYQLMIDAAVRADSGVYLCTALQPPGSVPSKVVLSVSALVVTSKVPTHFVRATTELRLQCNGFPLSYVYADLSQRWEYNGIVWKDYGITTLEAVANDVVPNVSFSEAGVWSCIIQQEDFGFKWVTEWMFVDVLPKPSIWSHLMEDTATAPIFGGLPNETYVAVIVLSLAAIIAGSIVGVTCYIVRRLS